jgi:hypothetical protein
MKILNHYKMTLSDLSRLFIFVVPKKTFLTPKQETTIMRKHMLFPIAALLIMGSMAACNGNKKNAAATDNEQSGNTTATTAPTPTSTPVGNQPLSYKIKCSPDTAILGKKGEAFVKFGEGKAIVLQDPDGKQTGIELNIPMTITNRSKLDNKAFFTISANDARLELDNGNAIIYKTFDGNSSPEAESTAQASITFEIPAQTKPAKLNLFLDGTRVATAVGLMEME